MASTKLTMTEYAVLGLLARHGERSGYELLKAARSGIGIFWSPAKSHVYDVLPRLARAGHAERRAVPQRGRPDKQLWRITVRGQAALRSWVNTVDPDPLADREAFLLKLFFGEHGDPDRLVAQVERYRDRAEAKLGVLRAIAAQPREDAAAALPLLTLRQGLAGTRAQLRWAEEVLPELQARVPAQAAT